MFMRRLCTVSALLCLLVLPLKGQVAVHLAPVPAQQFLSSTGLPLSGGCVFSYISGTSTPQATYADSTGLIQNANPLILDSGGFGSIWLNDAQTYRITVKSAGGVNCASGTQQRQIDGVNNGSLAAILGTNNTWSGNQTYNGNVTYNGSVTLASLTLSGPATFNGAMSLTAAYSTTGAGTHSGTETFSGSTLFKNLNAIRFADQFAGADCGAKINAADTDLGATAGEIWVNQNCGTTWTTAVTITNSHVLKFIQGGTYTTSAMITLAGSSTGILGTGGAMWTGATGVTTVIKEANAANLPAVVKMTGGNSGGNWLHDVAIDGNKVNQTCPSPPCYGVWNFKSIRPELRGASIQNAFSAGLKVESGAWPANESCCGSLLDNMILNNGGAALDVQASSDIIVTHNEFENSQYGALLVDSPNKRFVNNDFGGNTLNGINVTCTVAGAGSGLVITNNQFGNQNADDISINAWTGSVQCAPGVGSVITGNQFVSSGTRTANTFDAIKISNSKFNSITGNNCNPAPGATSFKYCLELLSPNTAEGRDMVTGNSFQGWGTGSINAAAATYALGNSGANSTILDGSVTLGQLVTSGPFTANAAGTVDLGSAGLPFLNLWLGTAATNNLKFQPAAMAAARVLTIPDPLGAVNMPYVIASGTTTLTANAALAAVTSQAANTTAAAGTLTTDSIEWSFATAPTAGDNLCHVLAYVTAGNVNFVRTNPTAAAQNVSALVINWRVIR